MAGEERMVERVARAIFGAWAADTGTQHTWSDLEEAVARSKPDEAPTLHSMYRQAFAEARAAIAAMREPTEGMIVNAYDWHLTVTAAETHPHRRGVWRSMIDAALSETPT